MPADGQIDAPARARKFVGDLSTRRTGSNHQHRALRQLAGIAVSVRMHLHDPGFWRHNGRNDRALKRSGGRDHVGGLDRALRRFGAEAGPAGLLVQRRHRDAAADWCGDPFGVGGKIVHHLVARREAVGINAGDG